jgi:hypothetical protein
MRSVVAGSILSIFSIVHMHALQKIVISAHFHRRRKKLSPHFTPISAGILLWEILHLRSEASEMRLTVYFAEIL